MAMDMSCFPDALAWRQARESAPMGCWSPEGIPEVAPAQRRLCRERAVAPDGAEPRAARDFRRRTRVRPLGARAHRTLWRMRASRARRIQRAHPKVNEKRGNGCSWQAMLICGRLRLRT